MPQTPPSPPGAIDTLERTLLMLLEGHQRLLETLVEKHRAIRRADIGSITRLCAEEKGIAGRLRDLERQRVQALTALGDAAGVSTRSVSAMAGALDEPQRGRVLGLAEQLRSAVKQVRRESSIARAAAEALNRHMVGVMQAAHGALSRAGVYGERGRLAVGAPIYSHVDLKS